MRNAIDTLVLDTSAAMAAATVCILPLAAFVEAEKGKNTFLKFDWKKAIYQACMVALDGMCSGPECECRVSVTVLVLLIALVVEQVTSLPIRVPTLSLLLGGPLSCGTTRSLLTMCQSHTARTPCNVSAIARRHTTREHLAVVLRWMQCDCAPFTGCV